MDKNEPASIADRLEHDAERAYIPAKTRANLTRAHRVIRAQTEALERIAKGDFNCSPHQKFMAAQSIAEAAIKLAQESADEE